MRLEVSVDDAPSGDRFEQWRATIFDTLAISAEPLPATIGPFRAHFSARSSGPLLNCAFASDGFKAIRQNREIAHRQWDGYRIYREYSAGVWFSIAGQEVVTSKGDMLVADADATFQARPIDRYSDESWLVPKSLITPHLPQLGRPLLMKLSGRDGVEALAANYLDTLTRNWDNIPPASMGPVTDTLSRLVAIACGAAAGEQPDAVRAGRLMDAKRHIDRHLAARDLSPASTAAALGIAVRTLHALFEPTGGSFARYVQRRRLEECRAALLASPARPVTDIAFAWGFGSLSSFYRGFLHEFGVSPSDLRAEARAAA